MREATNHARHGDAFFVAASPPLQSRACCGRLGCFMRASKIYFLLLPLLLLSCDVERKKYNIDTFCTGILAVNKMHPEMVEGDITFEECIESRVVVVSDDSNRSPIYAGKIISYHVIGDENKLMINVERFSDSKEICGKIILANMENIFETTLYTLDEDAYQSFSNLKDC